MGSSHRTERVAEMVRGFLGIEIQRLSDPRMQLLTITGVDMSPDLKSARVFWASHGEREACEEAILGVKSLLKRRMGEELKLRYTPDLHFKYDESVERGFRIDSLLYNLNKSGEQRRDGNEKDSGEEKP